MNNDDQKKPATGFVFKVLNGALGGIEFSLGPQDYFICVGNAESNQENLAFAERTLYIPSTESKNNFTVNLSDHHGQSHVDVTVCLPSHQEARQLQLNRICEVEGIHFAIKRDDESWSDEVKKGVLSPANQKTSDPVGMPQENFLPTRTSNSSQSLFVLVLLLVLGAGTVAGWNYLNSKPGVSVVAANQFQQLVGDRAGYIVQEGNDKMNYLFASNKQQADWAQQSIARKNLVANWRVVTPQTEEARISTQLERNSIAFFAIRFIDPGNPTLLMSSTRNVTDEANLNRVKQIMLTAMPYASSVNIVLHSDSDVLNKAQQGLKALGFEYQTMKSESGVTLSSWMPSVDVHLSEFGRYVSHFYQTWGQRYVHFSADIRDDHLKDQSYKYGDDGFITMNKSHWSFNKRQD